MEDGFPVGIYLAVNRKGEVATVEISYKEKDGKSVLFCHHPHRRTELPIAGMEDFEIVANIGPVDWIFGPIPRPAPPSGPNKTK